MPARRILPAGLILALLLLTLTGCGSAGAPSPSGQPAATAPSGTAVAPAASGLPAPGGSSVPTATAGVAQGSPGAAGTADPCALVTAAEAQAAMGVPVATTSPLPLSAGNGSGCVYESADGKNSLSLVVVGGEDKANFDTEFGAGASVTSVGSDAYFTVAGNTGTLAVWKNGTTLEIQITDESGRTAPAVFQAAATKVALSALARL